MKLGLRVALIIASSFIHMALVLGLSCSSQCAACWKDNDSNGADIKFTCGYDNDCGSECPSGYHDLHCAKWQRCLCFRDCSQFGPCWCGEATSPVGFKWCKAGCKA